VRRRRPRTGNHIKLMSTRFRHTSSERVLRDGHDAVTSGNGRSWARCNREPAPAYACRARRPRRLRPPAGPQRGLVAGWHPRIRPTPASAARSSTRARSRSGG
jgi:hypothetical protein